jgi:hypothetical protein
MFCKRYVSKARKTNNQRVAYKAKADSAIEAYVLCGCANLRISEEEDHGHKSSDNHGACT